MSEALGQNHQRIVLKNKLVIKTKDIFYIKSNGHYIEYYLKNPSRKEIERNSLTKGLTSLPKQFVRIHRSYIINIEHIKTLHAGKLMLSNDLWINISRTYKKSLNKLIKIKS